MSSKTFILGAGFSAEAGFPLVRELTHQLISFIKTEQHASARPHLTPQGQFYACWDTVDPDHSMGFEELMIAIRKRLPTTHQHDPCYTFERILRDACGRFLWHKHRVLKSLPPTYQNFASWFREHHLNGQPNAIVSFNWDLVAESALKNAEIPWHYTTQSPLVPVLKPHGSINWSDHLARGLRAPSAEWQQIAPGICYIPRSPLTDPFDSGVNQRLRKLILPGDQEEEGGVRLIWDEARKAIGERDEVVFIGYSLPRYDLLSTKFFQQVTSGKKIEVYTRSSETLQHHRELLGNVSPQEPIPFARCRYARACGGRVT
jgi:hypothetical protein